MLRAILVSLVLILLSTSPLWAGIKADGYTLTPMVGGQIFGGEQDLDDSLLWSLGLGYNLNERATIETVFSSTHADGDSPSDDDMDLTALRIDALYHFRLQKFCSPYFAAGIGKLLLNPEHGHNHQDSFINVGGGLNLFFTDRVALRADLRYLFNSSQTEHNLLYTAGIFFQFGYPVAASEPVAEDLEVSPQSLQPPLARPPQTPPDNDGDGVPNE